MTIDELEADYRVRELRAKMKAFGVIAVRTSGSGTDYADGRLEEILSHFIFYPDEFWKSLVGLHDHKGLLTIHQHHMPLNYISKLAESWEWIGGEPIENVRVSSETLL